MVSPLSLDLDLDLDLWAVIHMVGGDVDVVVNEALSEMDLNALTVVTGRVRIMDNPKPDVRITNGTAPLFLEG